MKVATWNINSIRARLDHLHKWLAEAQPDIVLLQETKVQDAQFPLEGIEEQGYNIAMVGEKSYNGVAILSKFPIEDIVTTLPGEEDRFQARYLEAFIAGVRFISVYVPNGQEVGTDKYHYKLSFLAHLEAHLKTLRNYGEKVVVGGDYNIAPHDEDTYDPKKFENRILASPKERAAFRRLLALGFVDALHAYAAAHHVHGPHFTWWDYRQGSWAQNKGLRIDHFLLSPQAADVTDKVYVDRTPRDWAKPSDHTPVMLTFSA